MKSLEELAKIREEALKKVDIRKDRKGTRIVVGMANVVFLPVQDLFLQLYLKKFKKETFKKLKLLKLDVLAFADLSQL